VAREGGRIGDEYLSFVDGDRYGGERSVRTDAFDAQASSKRNAAW
jgi:hypothetical protein